MDVEELVNEDVIPSPGPLDLCSVETRSIEVRDGDFLVLGSESAWAGLEGPEAVQAVNAWIREQEAPALEGKLRPHDSTLRFDLPWKDEDEFGFGWVGAMIPSMMRNFNAVFSH
jgi:hypothetical protein